MTDEIFKQFAAFHVDNGVPYFVSQHGNNYGTLLHINPTIEEETSDCFISWGWKSEKAIPGFFIKKPIPKLRRTSNNKNSHLMIIGHKDFSSSIKDTENERAQNAFIQRTYLDSLDLEIIKKTTVRFHPYSLKIGEKGLLEGVDDFALKSVNYGNTNINPLINRSRIVIHTYDSTGILETLSQNIPTIAFWHKESSPKTESADAHYRILEEVGIIHYAGESAANFINSNWANIDNWWLSQRVQNARMLFCNEYARTNRHPVGYLLRILKPS
jgi:putative transferase (TIGR04331 family)